MVYQDVTQITLVSDVPWLLMEPAFMRFDVVDGERNISWFRSQFEIVGDWWWSDMIVRDGGGRRSAKTGFRQRW
ncbi:hypothetical protein LguiB_001509 [Lonicera macranthoides]